VPAAAVTLAEALRGAGYATYAVADNVNLIPELGFAQGFERFRNYTRRKSADAVNAGLAEWRDELRRTERFFLYLHYLDPHEPYLRRAPWYDPTRRGAAGRVSAYDSEIRYADERIREAFESLGGLEDALVVVTADHGEELGDHGSWGHSQHLLAEVLDVPLLMRFPGRAHAGSRLPAPVSHVDLLPTLREAAGLPADPQLPGTSLLPLLRGGRAPERALFAHLQRSAEDAGVAIRQRAVIEGDWKYLDAEPGGPMLFHRRRDPGDHENVAARHPELTRALQRRLDAFERSARRLPGEARRLPLDREEIEELRALGYAN
jgi:arylsulfatase A-like enzyme